MEGHDPSTAPDPTSEVVQMTRDQYELLINQLAAASSSPVTAPDTSGPRPSSSSRPSFTKPGLARQFEFNTKVMEALTPIVAFAPEEEGIRANLLKAITLLTQRNELLAVADTDPEVFDFYDQHSKAEAMQVSNPILAAFIREKKKKDDKKPAPTTTRSSMWRARFLPYRPFRFGGAARAPAPQNFQMPFQQGRPFPPRAPHPQEENAEGTAVHNSKMRMWKAVVSQVARREKEGTAMSFRWSLSSQERAEIQGKPALKQWRRTPSQQNQQCGGETILYAKKPMVRNRRLMLYLAGSRSYCRRPDCKAEGSPHIRSAGVQPQKPYAQESIPRTSCEQADGRRQKLSKPTSTRRPFETQAIVPLSASRLPTIQYSIVCSTSGNFGISFRAYVYSAISFSVDFVLT
ncbi:unnamed protein product [Cylicocyclus nassatus]|uniref:Uncharacterized protein n=1 Tax=Cylicocyclus nassatus TaxID=53992 RepID=A0AA36DJJ1_CYLNA|nr:unnamed protein product [Cylicocyclus nassatus]